MAEAAAPVQKIPEVFVAEVDEEQETSFDRPIPYNAPPSPGSAASSLPSSRCESPTADLLRKQSALEKMTRTVKFVKRWARKGEETAQGREAFMKRFSVTVAPVFPSTDDRSNSTPQPSAKDSRAAETADGGAVPVKKPRLRNYLRRIVLNPMNQVLYRWLTVVSIAFLYDAYVLIARQTFTQLQDEPWKLAVWLLLDYTADSIYIADMIVQCRTSYIEQGLLVINSLKMALRYIKSRYFILDILSIIPLDLLYIIPVVGVAHPIVRINRLLRIHRMWQFFYQAESRTNWPNALRIFNLMMYISLFIHWNACFYFLISKGIGFGSDGWVYPNISDPGFDTFGRQYLFSLYWSTLTLTTIGEVPGPEVEVEYAFVIFDFLVGVLIFATIVGMMGGIITNMNVRRTEFQSRLDNIKQYMRYRNVEKPLQRRVITWFNYLWTNNQSLDEEMILDSLPDKLHAEIAIQVHFETLSRVKIFEECETSFLEELVLKLKPQVFSPGDYICRKGDIGKEMYIVKKGKLEVLIDQMDRLDRDGNPMQLSVATLTDGSCFGEISLLSIGKQGNRRTAHVRSIGYSDLFCLSKADLLEVLEEYPEAKAILEKKAKETLKRDGSSADDETEQAAGNRRQDNTTESMEKRIAEMENKMEQLRGRLTRLYNEYTSFQSKIKQRVTRLERDDR